MRMPNGMGGLASGLFFIVVACSSSAPEEIPCVTTFDCPLDQICSEDGFCIDPPEGGADRDGTGTKDEVNTDRADEEADDASPTEEDLEGDELEAAVTDGDGETADEYGDLVPSDEENSEADTSEEPDVSTDISPDTAGDEATAPDADEDAPPPDFDGGTDQAALDLDTVLPDPETPPDDDTTQPDPDTPVDNDVPVTRIFTCADKPANSIWNSVSSYEQTWTGGGWMPPDSPTIYNETPTTSACHFVCAPDFSWDGTQCLAIPHECSSNPDCTSDPNRPVCDTTVSPRRCVMCLQNSDCHTQYGEQCDIGARQCWSGFTCQHSLWTLPRGGVYDWDDGLQGWQETTNFWKRRTGYYTPTQSGAYSFGYLQSTYCDWETGYGCYEPNWNETGRLSGTYDMSFCTSCTVKVSFSYTGRVEYSEYGDSPDPFFATCSGTGGASWVNDVPLSPYYYYDSESGYWNWGYRQWTLPASCLTNSFTLGLRFTSNSWSNEVGVTVDDLSISHPAGNLPKGNFDAVTNGPGSTLWGWTCDPDNYALPLLVQVAFYPQGNLNTTPVVKWLRAASLREEAVGTQCGGERYHGFVYTLEESVTAVLGSGTHTAYAWAVNIPAAGWGALCGGHFKQLGVKQFSLP